MVLPAGITSAVASLPEALRPQATRWFERALAEHPQIVDGPLPALAKIVAVSEFAAAVLLRDPEFLRAGISDPSAFRAAGPPPGFSDTFAAGKLSPDAARARLRRERNRALFGILWRDAIERARVEETLTALSALADRMIAAAVAQAAVQMRERCGTLRDAEGAEVPLVTIGMGKLGGGELNFSSDIDVIFAYPRDGESDGRKALSAQQYFDRMSRHVVALLDETTADGFVYRTDTRLRPFGDSGPPVVSFAALESYLLQHGRDWERYAYVKARIVGPRPPDSVRNELFRNLILPFVYRRYLDYGVFESLREMHAMIAAEVARRELRDNIKLGPGGIREIEFIVQSLQLVRGGSRPELATPSLLDVLPRLVDARGLGADAAASLADAYRFLRRLENYIQAIRDQQAHELPRDSADRERLVLALGCEDWQRLIAELDRHRDVVASQFARIAFRDGDDAEDDTLRQRIDKLWESGAGTDAWAAELAACGFDDGAATGAAIVRFREQRSTQSIDSAAASRLQTFMPRLIALARDCDSPARAVSRTLSVVEQVLRRSAYLALLNENRLAADRLVRLCEQSAYITAELARFPVLLDELLDPSAIGGPLTRDALGNELDERLAGRKDEDAETRMEFLAQFQRSNLFRIAVADFGGELPIMKVSDSLTFLAETVLEHALATAWRDLTVRHGVPRYRLDDEVRPAGFGIIAYGKLGGLELSYGSDLDIVFLHDSRGSAQSTDGDKPLDNTMFFSRLVRRLVHFLTTRTSTGALYEIDMRLRPSGRKGLLVTSTEAFERYQEENAWTWEHQALLRARPVAGSAAVAASFERIRSETLTRRVRRRKLKADVIDMRARMRRELDRSDAERFDLKQGEGGIGDIEFVVQFLVLENAAQQPSVIEYTDNIRQLDALAACGAVSAATAATLQDIYRRYRLRQHRLVLNDEQPLVAAGEFATERQTVAGVWQRVFA